MKKQKISIKSILEEYWIEILALIIVLLGVVLVRYEKSYLIDAKAALSKLGDSAMSFISQFSTYDLVGGLAILAGMAFILWRIRYRIQKSQRWLVRDCPRCGSPLHRIHRTTLDRIIGLLLLPHSRRFRCDNPDCRWTGLRYGRHHSDSSERDFPIVPDPNG